MAFTGRTYNKGEKPHQAFRKHTDLYRYLKVGKVTSVDPDRLYITIEWETGSSGSRSEVPITFPYAGPSGCYGSLPEKDSRVVCAVYDEGDNKGSPLVIGYLPTGLKQGYQYNQVQNIPEALSKSNPNDSSQNPSNQVMYRFKPMSEGDMRMVSPAGGKVAVNKGVNLADHLHNSIIIRPSDQSIIATSVNNFLFADGASVSMGQAIRNSKTIFDGNGNRIENSLAREATLADGREAVYIVPFGKKIDSDSRYFSEFRIDVDEICDGYLDNNDINGISATSTRNPVVTLALGNYIGANLSDKTYGEVIRPVLFSSPDDTEGSFDLVSCVQNNGLDEVSNIGLAFAVHGNISRGFLGLDKEGHFYMNLPGSSTSNPLGAGRSMSILAAGNLKEIWGASPDDGNSWDLTANGGAWWRIGHDNDNIGFHLETSGSTDTIVGTDKNETIYGSSISEISGIKTESIGGQYSLSVAGLKTETVFGSVEGMYMADLSMHVFGKFSETAMAEKQCKFGKRKTSIVAGNDELDITIGNLTELISIGSRKTSVITGSISNDIITGNFSTSIKIGVYEVNVMAGNINIKTTAGTARLESKLATTIAALSVSVEGSTVKLGKGLLKGGIVTGLPFPSHYDYTTGAPLRGSVTVSSA